MAQILYHMAPQPRWEKCVQEKAEDYTPESYAADGFVHLTEDPQALIQVANHFYKSSQDPWILMCLSAEKLTHEVLRAPCLAVVGH